jgi:hypothetical protein
MVVEVRKGMRDQPGSAFRWSSLCGSRCGGVSGAAARARAVRPRGPFHVPELGWSPRAGRAVPPWTVERVRVRIEPLAGHPLPRGSPHSAERRGPCNRSMGTRCRLPQVLQPDIAIRGFPEPRAAYPVLHVAQPRAATEHPLTLRPLSSTSPRVADVPDHAASCPMRTSSELCLPRAGPPPGSPGPVCTFPPAASRPQGHRGGLLLQQPDGAWRKHAQRLW